VDEACSGVRSLQSSLMAALFVGEYFRLGVRERLWLLPAGWAVAIAMNIVRALWLSLAALHGTMELWHDPAGLVILLVVMGALWWLGLRLAGPAPAAAAPAPAPAGGWGGAALLLMGLLGVEGLNEAWYRRQEGGAPAGAGWTVDWEAFPGRREPREIPGSVRSMLRYSGGASYVLAPRQGEMWLAHYLHWEAGRTAALLARSHTPEVCLPSGGAQLLEKSGPSAWRREGIELQIWRYVFDWRGQRLEVRYAMSEQGVSTAGQDIDDYYSKRSRLAAAWEGRRHRGQRVLTVAMAGTEDPDAEFARFLDTVVRTVPEPSDVP
jgi:exosortase/archaeosortase family protein